MTLARKISLTAALILIATNALVTYFVSTRFTEESLLQTERTQAELTRQADDKISFFFENLHTRAAQHVASGQPLSQLCLGVTGCRGAVLTRRPAAALRWPDDLKLDPPDPQSFDRWNFSAAEAGEIDWHLHLREGTLSLRLAQVSISALFLTPPAHLGYLASNEGRPLVTLWDHSGRKVVPLTIPRSWLDPKGAISVRTADGGGAEVIATIHPMRALPRSYLVSLSSLGSLRALEWNTWVKVAGLSFATVFLFAFLSALFFRRITGPLALLSEKMSRVAEERRVPLDRSLTSRRDEIGGLSRAFVRMQSDLITAQEERARADRLATLGQLSAVVAHEVRNPLTGIIASAQVAEESATEIPPKTLDVLESLATIGSEARRANEVLQRLLGLTRKQPAERAVIDARGLVEQAAKSFRARAELAGIRIELSLGKEPAWIECAWGDLIQVAMNLLQNASDALEQEPRRDKLILVEIRFPEDSVEIRVSDNGPGVSAEAQKRLFQPFFTTKEGNRGTGLGLANAKSIVHAQSGTLSYERASLGGACFVIRLPTRESPTALSA